MSEKLTPAEVEEIVGACFPEWLRQRTAEQRVRLLQVLLSKAALEARRRNYWI